MKGFIESLGLQRLGRWHTALLAAAQRQGEEFAAGQESTQGT